MGLTPEETKTFSPFAADGTSDGLLCLDGAGSVLYANQAAARALGPSAPDLCKKDIFGLAPEMNPSLWKELRKEIRAGAPFGFEFTLQGVPDRSIQVEITAYGLLPDGRELVCLFFRDV